ncbi:YadA-like family protein [Haemophilus haemolyticus]|uniref:YadA-like family protein n=1 Tax=Haemophilus haemolyticus TaxID=726 RepID=UPI0019582B5E|nr:YadA-like family protein [Haemophilus haemolyticus]VTX72293.1 Autotransporter adhesin SadA [Haemophilus haemolyticus]
MNNIFKIIWNKTTQRIEVVSELAKGAVKASSGSHQSKSIAIKSTLKLSLVSLCLGYVNNGSAAVGSENGVITYGDYGLAIGGYNGGAQVGPKPKEGNRVAAVGNRQISIGHDKLVASGNNSIIIGTDYGHANAWGLTHRQGGTQGFNTVGIGAGAQSIGLNALALGAASGSGVGYQGYDDAVYLGSFSRITPKGLGQNYTDAEINTLNNIYTKAVEAFNQQPSENTLNTVKEAGRKINNAALNKVEGMTIKSNVVHPTQTDKFTTQDQQVSQVNGSSGTTTVSILSLGGKDGDKTMYRQIQNVAAGRMSADSFDAVNGSQLYYVRNYTGWNIGHNSNNQETVTGRVNNDHTVIFKANGNYVNVSTTLDSTNKSTVNIGVNTSDISVTKNNERITAVAANNPTNTVATATSVKTALDTFNEVKADKNTKFTINAGNKKVKDLTLGNDSTVNFKAEDGLEVESKNDAVVYKLNAESKQSIADAKAAATTVTNKLNEINKSVQRAETAAQTATNKAAEANTAATKAKASENAAATSAKTASTKAAEATAAAGKAKESEAAAATSAKTASDKADEAAASAQTATDKAAEANSSAEKAKASENAAATSAKTASDKADEAATSAQTATDKAAEATAAAGKAKASETKAKESETKAKESETNAKTSEDNVKIIEKRIENSGLISKDGKTAFAADNTSGRNSAKASGKDSTAMGYGSEANGDHSTALGNNAKANAVRSTAIGHNADAKASGSVALGEGSIAKEENTVSVGDIGHERRITNVQDPKNLTDAANKRYVDNSISSVRSELKQTDKKLRGGIAGAVAMANIPTANRAGGTMVGIGVGSFKGQSAVAVGVNRASDSNRVHFKMSGSATTSGDYAVGAGMGYQW